MELDFIALLIFLPRLTLTLKPAVVAEWSKPLSQIQVKKMSEVPGSNPHLGLYNSIAQEVRNNFAKGQSKIEQSFPV